jgi:hypothetical protein
MKNVKRKYHKEANAYFENVSHLYDVFNDNISFNEYQIWKYITKMENYEIGEMFIVIITKLEKLDLTQTYLDPVLFRFLICEYIMELKQNEGQ